MYASSEVSGHQRGCADSTEPLLHAGAISTKISHTGPDIKLKVKFFEVACHLSLVVKCFVDEPQHEISNTVVCETRKGSDQPAYTRSLIRAYASRLNVP